MGHPGKKLVFMGAEIGQTSEWNSEGQVEWWLLDYEIHRKFQAFCAALNEFYTREPALYEVDFHWEGFEWIDFHDMENSMIAFIRHAKNSDEYVVFVCNFTPQLHTQYRLGLPESGEFLELFNSDSAAFGGSNMGNGGRVVAEAIQSHGREASAAVTIPPLGVVVLKPARLAMR